MVGCEEQPTLRSDLAAAWFFGPTYCVSTGAMPQMVTTTGSVPWPTDNQSAPWIKEDFKTRV
jgi:hypothetical protein